MEKVGIKMNQNEIWMIQGTDYKENTKHLLEEADLETKIKKKMEKIKIVKSELSPILSHRVRPLMVEQHILRW